jgi:flagellar biosynthesis protein FlhA
MSLVESPRPTAPVAAPCPALGRPSFTSLGYRSASNTLNQIGALSGRSDILLAIAILGIVIFLIVPLPSILLDLMLAVSITFSVLILLTALFIETPLEFSAFPTVLLIATMLRLSLNVATTRLILANGHNGPGAAGHVIEAFGSFVMSGNFVIGLVVFAILLIVNFIVITKGSGRIAEVAARFTLDAMPGKQMAIDAELAAGHIDEATARSRRKTLENESSFFGAMDGASKFVRGDAIAGLLITFINVIGGIIIGVAQQNLSFGEAAHTYTLLTVGDGVVSQIPALIVSTAAGLLVSKAGVSGAADKALVTQLATMPKALGLSAAVIAVMGLLPGIPVLPFFGLGAGLAYAAHRMGKKIITRDAIQTETTMGEDQKPLTHDETSLSEARHLDELRIEIGYALMALVNAQGGSDRLTEQIRALRRTLASEMGFVMPSVRILDNVMLPSNSYTVYLKEIEAGQGQVYPELLMAMDPTGAPVKLPGNHVLEPTFGLAATWIEQSMREEAQLMGYTVVDAATVITTHLTEIVKGNVAELLGYADVQKLIRELPKEHTDLVKDIVPSQIQMTAIQRVLQSLLSERVSIRDLSTVLEGIADAVNATKSPRDIVEIVRQRLSRQICAQYVNGAGQLPIIALSPQWETAFAEAIIGQGEERHLAMAPSKLSEFAALIRDRFEEAARQGESPVLVTSAQARPFVRAIVERFRRETPVISQAEIHLRARLKTISSV